MADIVTNFATVGAESTVRAFEATDRAIVKATASAREQSSVQSKQAQLLRALRDAERSEQQQLRQSEGIIRSLSSAEDKHRKNVELLGVARDKGTLSVAKYNQLVAESERRTLGAGDAVKKTTSAVSNVKFDKVVGGIRNVTAAVIGGGGVVAALSKWADANRKIIDQSNLFDQSLDTRFRAFSVQSGLRGEAAKAAENKIFDVAEMRRVPVEQAADSATQLISAGFSSGEVLQGGSLNTFLRGLSASNLSRPDVDAAGLARAASQYLSSQGMEKNSENLDAVMRNMQALFKATDVQLSDLQEFARVASLGKGRLSIEEQFSTFSSLREVLGAPGEAATAFRQIVGRLTTASSSKAKVAALGQLGLKPEQVDLIGEDIGQVLDLFQTGLQRLPEKDRAPLLKQIFEEQGSAAFQALLNGGGNTIRQRVETQKTAGATFDADVQTAEAGPAKVAVLQETEQKRLLRARSQDESLFRSELKTVLLERGVAPISLEASETAFNKSIGLGIDEALTAGVAVTGVGADGDVVDEVKQRVRNKLRIDQQVTRDLAQLPGIGAATSEELKNADAFRTRGFNPAARLERTFDDITEAVGLPTGNADELFAGGFKYNSNGYDPRRGEVIRALRRLSLDAPELDSGEIESRGADILRATAGPNGRLSPAVGEAAARLDERSAEFAASELQTLSEINRRQLDALETIAGQNAEPTPFVPERSTVPPETALLSRTATD